MPMLDRIIVRKIDDGDKSTGGIVLMGGGADPFMRGEVIAVGPGRRDQQGHIIPMSLKGKERVLFDKSSGQEITLDKEKVLIMFEADVIGVLK